MSDVLHIREPYYSAGKKYGWPGKPIGLGINMKLLQGGGTLRVRVGDSDKIWYIEKKDARAVIDKFKAKHYANNTLLGVVPWVAFRPENNKPDNQAMLFDN